MRASETRGNRHTLRSAGFRRGLVAYSADFIDPFGVHAEDAFEPGSPADDYEALRSDWKAVGRLIEAASAAIAKEAPVKPNGS